jgi:hypothetical protein
MRKDETMNSKQKMTPLPRWLINIGLTLQFYIPCSIRLFLVSGVVCSIFSELSRPRYGTPLENEGVGMMAAAGVLLLFILLVEVVWYVIYWHQDRYGDQCNALEFLIVINFFLGGFWLYCWIGCFSSTILYDPNVWVFSPVPIVIPTILYIIAWVMMRLEETKND